MIRVWMPLLTAVMLCSCKEKSEPIPPQGRPGVRYERPLHRVVPGASAITVVFKHKDDPMGPAFERGARLAVEEIGREVAPLTLRFEAPDQPSVEGQAAILERERKMAANLILLDVAHPLRITPYVRKVQVQEMFVVTLESDCDVDRSRRMYWVTPLPREATGRLLADLTAREAGTSGKVAVISATHLAIPQQRWLTILQESLAGEYGGVPLVAVEYSNDQATRARAVAEKILAEHPDLTTLLVLSRHAMPAVAAAVEAAGAQQRVAVLGLGSPNSTREFMKRGTIRYLITWDAERFGYFSLRAGRMIMSRVIGTGSRVVMPKVGLTAMVDEEFPMGEPLVVTAETVDAYNF